ncbi:MAG TPA: cytochrome c [Pyrinomonadaceae bacterium]|jgi:mono/diheme cytochrome c family protein
MKIFLKGLLILAAILLPAGWWLRASSAGVRPQEPKKEEAAAPDQSARARTIFKERCARCHGADGRGETVVGRMLSVPDFTDEEWWKKDARDDRFRESITEGKNEMPAFGKKLSRQEIRSLVAYVRRFGKPAH